ncbi:TetR/AcrR family transcriptional regulator [Chromatiaceae bacterium AAb-1]|nr:TetR/AcrR family transcriptional regulator [Chromatiaceae bacterium AAb-1]
MEKKLRTKDKILQASIELFNQIGERQVTTNHIAAHLGISPGNLYYHFRNKEDIVRHIFKDYTRLLETRITLPGNNRDPLKLLTEYLDAVFELMWRFQFFYASLPDILLRDPLLQQDYLKVQADVLQKVTDILKILKNSGVLDMADEEMHDMAHTIKMLVTFWVSYVKTQHADQTIDQAAVYRGVLKVLLLFKAYATEPYQPRLEQLRRHYESLGRPDTAK